MLKESYDFFKGTNITVSKETQKLALLLLTMDFVFIFLHLAYMLAVVKNPLLSIEMDRGYAEVYQYTKEIWACVLLTMLATKEHRLFNISWALLFAYLFLDDSMQIHENVGEMVSEYFNFQPMLNLRAKDFGELFVSATAGIIIFGLIAFASLKSDMNAKRRSIHMFFQIGLLAFFGVLVDMIHIAIPWGNEIWGLIEDGGEMIIMTMVLAYVFNLKPANGEIAETAQT